MGGIGLHTGEYSYLRVRPAFANEGRYFVRVPPGTNADLFELQGAQEGGIEELGPNAADELVDTEIESLRLQLFQEYLEGQEKGFEGTFPEYIETMDAERKEEVIQRWEGWERKRIPLTNLQLLFLPTPFFTLSPTLPDDHFHHFSTTPPQAGPG